MSSRSGSLATRAVDGTPTLAEVRGWPAVVSVPRGGSAAGLSKSHSYELIARGEFPFKVLKVGGSLRVLTASIIRVLSGEEA